MGLILSRREGEGLRLRHEETGEVFGTLVFTRLGRRRSQVAVDAPAVIRIERVGRPPASDPTDEGTEGGEQKAESGGQAEPDSSLNAHSSSLNEGTSTEVLPWVPSDKGPRPAA